MKEQQRGGILIEVLVSLTIFAVGVVGLLGSMAVTSQFSNENRFRTEAVSIADELLGQMAVSKAATLSTDYVDTSANFQNWLTSRVKTLPNGQATIVFPAGAASAGGTFVQLTIFWKSPDSKAGAQQAAYTTTTYFR